MWRFSHHPATLLGILCHAHFWFGLGQGKCTSRSCLKIAILCLSLAVHRLVQEAYSSLLCWISEVEGLNCLQTKWKAWGSYGLEMVTGSKTAKKSNFARWSLFSYPTTYPSSAHIQYPYMVYKAAYNIVIWSVWDSLCESTMKFAILGGHCKSWTVKRMTEGYL